MELSVAWHDCERRLLDLLEQRRNRDGFICRIFATKGTGGGC